MIQSSSTQKENDLVTAAARYSIRAVYADKGSGSLSSILGGDASTELIRVVDELRSENQNKTAIRRVGSSLVVRTVTHNGAALVWVTEGALSSVHQQITELGRLTDLFHNNQVEQTPQKQLIDTKKQIAIAVAELPETRKSRWLKQVALALSTKCDWQDHSILEVIDGRLKRIYSSTRDGNDRHDDFDALISVLDDEKRFITSYHDDDHPAINFYMSNYGISEFSLYVPKNGFGFYLEAECDENDLIFASHLLAKRREVRPALPKTWRSVVAAGMALAVIIYALWPTPNLIGAPAQIRPTQSKLQVALHDARLLEIRTQVGEAVEIGDILAVLSSPQIEATHEDARLDLALEKLNAQQALGDDDLAAYDLARQRSDIMQLRTDQTSRHVEELVVRAGDAGRIADVVDQGQIGAIIPVGSVIVEIQKTPEMNALLTLDPGDGVRVSKGMEGDLLLRGSVNQTYKITMIEDPVLLRGADGQQSLTVLAELHGEENAELYKGLSGFAQLRGERGPRVLNYLHPLTEFIRLTIWKYTGWRV